MNEFKSAQTDDTKKDSAETAQEFYDLLKNSKFFIAYPNLSIDVTKLHGPISKFLDKRIEWIKAAAQTYFKLVMFRGQGAKVDFGSAEGGSRSAVNCYVTVNSTKHNFRIKTNHNAGESSRCNIYFLCIIE